MSTLLTAGSVLANRYRVLEPVGRGGMAEVFRGMDDALEREIAIKVLTDRADEVRRRFLMEAQAMARLNHSNIVAVYDVGADNDLSYIILEFVRGQTLREMRNENLPVEKAIDLTLQVLAALQYAHGHGIIHRDIKPGNLIISSDNVLKVMDFGLARRMSDVSNLTQSGAIAGTLAYLPPERFLGKSGDRASDLYSVGVLLYELLCGQLPFALESGDLVAVMYAHVNDRPKPPRYVNAQIPPSLERIVMRLLEKEPSRRYGDATSLIVDLKAVRTVIGAARSTLQEVRQELVLEQDDSVPKIDRDEPLSSELTAENQTRHFEIEPANDAARSVLASKTFSRALTHVMQGMINARKQQWREAEEHYTAAIALLRPLEHPTELARTYARLGGLYCAKLKAGSAMLPSDVAAARGYLVRALPVLREKRLNADVQETEANLKTLDALSPA